MQEKEGIRYLLHTGDVVNNRNSDSQWDNAVAAMNRLEGRLPYLISAGNHDVGAPTEITTALPPASAEKSRKAAGCGKAARANTPFWTQVAFPFSS